MTFDELFLQLRLKTITREQAHQLSLLAQQAYWHQTAKEISLTEAELRGHLRVAQMQKDERKIKALTYEIQRRELGGGAWPVGLPEVASFFRT